MFCIWRTRDHDLTDVIDKSEVDSVLLNEFHRLVEKEEELEMQLDRIKDAVHEKYPDLSFARIVISDILTMDYRTTVRRFTALMAMKERAIQLIETADHEIVNGQWPIKRELVDIKQLRNEVEEQIKGQSANRISYSIMKIPTKLTRWAKCHYGNK